MNHYETLVTPKPSSILPQIWSSHFFHYNIYRFRLVNENDFCVYEEYVYQFILVGQGKDTLYCIVVAGKYIH